MKKIVLPVMFAAALAASAVAFLVSPPGAVLAGNDVLASNCCAQANSAQAAGATGVTASTVEQPPAPVVMPEPGKKVWVGADYYFIYGFDHKPKLGPLVLKVQLFNKNDVQVSTLDLQGDSDMPSMRGAHSMGRQPFKLNKKGDYLLPLTIVMPGEWEVIVYVLKDGKYLYAGFHRFKV